MKYYDKQNNRLVFISTKANESFWDEMWQEMQVNVRYQKKLPKFNLYLKATQKYLKRGSVILEGGCGLAQTAWNLHLLGYKAIALDYTPKTIDLLKQKIPEVNPMLGDVRKLPFENESIDGYWSFGVIEHFYEGYDDIVIEANRVLQNGGYFFLTFPHMSKIRRWKAYKNDYPQWVEDGELKNYFYQFALDEKKVIEKLRQYHFEFIYSKPFDGIGGYRREVTFGKKFFDAIDRSKSFPVRAFAKILDVFMAFFTSHSILLVFRKKY